MIVNVKFMSHMNSMRIHKGRPRSGELWFAIKENSHDNHSFPFQNLGEGIKMPTSRDKDHIDPHRRIVILEHVLFVGTSK